MSPEILREAWSDVIIELIGKGLRAAALADEARGHAQQASSTDFNTRYTGIAEHSGALADIYRSLAEHASAELAKLTPSMQGEKVKP